MIEIKKKLDEKKNKTRESRDKEYPIKTWSSFEKKNADMIYSL
jgi:hypothetical protein